MKYGESVFDILYLLFAIISGCLILYRAKDRTEKTMGWAVLILGAGDAFHLVPRVLAYYLPRDFSFFLGAGKLITSITVTIFYVLLYYLWMGRYHKEEVRTFSLLIRFTAVVRIIICLFPQNGWIGDKGSIGWAVLRNIPLVLLGICIGYLYYRERNADRCFRHIWLYILFSFLFYIPVALGAGILPALGMLMLPKTICYILMIRSFLLGMGKREDRKDLDRS